MSQLKITKQQLVDVLTSWGQDAITTDQLQEWMLDHYDPDEVIIGEGESQVVQEAMNIVMNEYELAKQEKILRQQYQLALDFINSVEDDFLTKRSQFLRHAFKD